MADINTICQFYFYWVSMRIELQILKKPLITLLIAAAAGGAICFLANFTFFEPLFDQFEFVMRDIRSQYRALSLERGFEGAVILDIDNRSIYKLGKMRGWPREYFARTIDYLKEGGAEAVVFDIIFDRGLSTSDDSILTASVRNASNVFSSISFAEADSENFFYAMNAEPKGFDCENYYYLRSLRSAGVFRKKPIIENDFFNFINESAGTGFVNSNTDRDGVIRAADLLLNFNGHLYPSLSMSVLMKALEIAKNGITLDESGDLRITAEDGSAYSIPLDDKGRFLVDYLGTFKTIRYISFYDVLEKRVPAQFFADKIVFVGTSATGMSDLKSVPVQQNFPGVEIHANILANLLERSYIYDIDQRKALLIVFLMCLLAAFASLYLKTWQSIIVLIVVGLGYLLGSMQYFAVKGVFTEIIHPEASLFLSYLGAMIYKYIAEEKDKRFIKSAFGHFVDKEVVKEILDDRSKLKLGGERRELSFLFNDIRNFTTISEQMKPEILATFLNVHLTEMTNIVFRQGGLLDKYIGDAVVALFGAPIPKEDHAMRASRAALEMIRAVKIIRVRFKDTPMEDLRIGVGVNSGEAAVGNMGSDFRFEYTAIGDAMNLGARLEGLTKYYGVPIILAETTVQELDDTFIVRQLDLVKVKGKLEAVGIYQLIDPDDDFPPEAIDLYLTGLKAYIEMKWDEAESLFNRVLAMQNGDEPALLMLKRIEYLRTNPPSSDWNGAYEFDKK